MTFKTIRSGMRSAPPTRRPADMPADRYRQRRAMRLIGHSRARLARAFVVVAALMLAAASAAAHAVLLDRAPAEGAELSAAPTRLLLRFDEPVTPVALRLIDADGHVLAGPGGVVGQDETLRLDLPTLEKGRYLVSYRVISADSHPVGGSYVFSVGVAGGAVAAPEASPGWTVASVLLRALLLGFSLTAAGSAFWPTTRQQRRRANGIALLAALMVAIWPGVEGGLALAEPGVSLLDRAVWAVGLQSGVVRSALAGAAGLAVLTIGLAAGSRRLSGLGSLAIAAAFLLSGHVTIAAPIWLSRPALLMHLLCAAAWIAALPLLRHRVRSAPMDAAARSLRRFSCTGLWLVGLLALSGAVMVVVQAGSVGFLLGSRYGAVLAGKLVFAMAATGLAIRNRSVLLPALEHGESDAPARLLRAMRGQIWLLAAAFFMTALLEDQVPPRSLAAQAEHNHRAEAASSMALLSDGNIVVMLHLTQREAGRYGVALMVHDAAGRALAPLSVTLRFARPAEGIEPILREILPADGVFAAENLLLPMPGDWAVEASVLTSEFTETSVRGMIAVGTR